MKTMLMVSRSWAGATGGRWVWLLKGHHAGVCRDATVADLDCGGGSHQHAHVIKLHITKHTHTHKHRQNWADRNED